jgi:hypothetical protein
MSNQFVDDTKGTEWPADCETERGRLLSGTWAHYCFDWDGLPVDETTWEFSSCHCYDNCTCDDCLDGLMEAKKAMSDDFDKADAEATEKFRQERERDAGVGT